MPIIINDKIISRTFEMMFKRFFTLPLKTFEGNEMKKDDEKGMKKTIKIVEVGPRDGLQNEPFNPALTTNAKVNLIKMLVDAGLRNIEVGSIVNPKRVPQMADTIQILSTLGHDFKEKLKLMERGIEQNEGEIVHFPILIPNRKGMELALMTNQHNSRLLSEISVFTAASNTFNRHNINCDIQESLIQIGQVIKLAKESGIERIRGYISTVIGCPYEGWINPEQVYSVAQELLNLGCYEISLGDTIGIGTPGHIEKLLEYLLIKGRMEREKFAVHFHDTYGQALANVHVALGYGIMTIDSSIGGLGGCPFAPGATGNLATEDLVYMLHGMQLETGIDWENLIKASEYINRIMKRKIVSKAANAWIQKREKNGKMNE